MDSFFDSLDRDPISVESSPESPPLGEEVRFAQRREWPSRVTHEVIADGYQSPHEKKLSPLPPRQPEAPLVTLDVLEGTGLVSHRFMSVMRIVLHRPENPANVGAAARVIANAGLQGLDLVDPCDYRTVEAWRMAWGAEDILEQARVFVTLEEALADCVYVAGLVGRRPRRVEPITPRAMASEVSELASSARAALVFGCESKGLTEKELCLCQRRVRIPSHSRQPSLNLAQAVMVSAYEVFVAQSGGGPPPPRAPHHDANRALSRLKDAFLEIGFLPSQNPEARFVEWRELFGRAGLTPREVKLLLALARRIRNTSRVASRARTSNAP